MASTDREDLELLRFSREEASALLRWEHEHEFEYRGQMYDVVESAVQNDTLYFWCWWDREETELNQKLGKLASMALNSNPERKEQRKNLISYFKSLYFQNFNEQIEPPVVQCGCHNSFYQFCFQSRSSPPPLPPPKMSCT